MVSEREFEVVVVGAGPAGIAAACAAAGCGKRVGLVDDNPEAGGQIWRFGAPEGEPWFERLRRSGAEVIPGARVFDHPATGVLHAERDGERLDLRYEQLILATGARERFLPFPGWTLPNVLGAGGLQALVKSGLPIEGKRVVVAGSGPLLLAVADYLHSCGAVVPVIAEQASSRHIRRLAFTLAALPGKLLEAARRRLSVLRTRYLTDCWVVAAEGDGKLAAVTLQRNGTTWREPCDYLACGFGLVPNLELPLLVGCKVERGYVSVNEWQRTSIPGVACVGELCAIGGVDPALASGLIAGYTAGDREDKAREHFAALRRARKFASRLEAAFALREELKAIATPETIVCRCEDVPLGKIAGQHNWRSAKLQTRCGMGPCQARVCGPVVDFLCGWPAESVRPPLFPVEVGRLVDSR